MTVHKRDCPNVKREDEPERFIHVDWGKAKELYPVRITMVAYDRVGLLNDLTRNVSEEGVNMASVNTGEYQDGKVTMTLTVFTTGMGAVGKAVRQAGGHPRLYLGPPRAFQYCRRLAVTLEFRPCLSCSYPVKM